MSHDVHDPGEGIGSALVGAIAAYGLPTRLHLPHRVLDDERFDCALRAARDHRVLGMLAVAVGEGAFPVTDSQRDRLAGEEQAWAAHVLRIERLLLDVAGMLERAGTPYRVFKGPALAHRAYPDPSWRLFADIDLLVPGARLDDARNAIVTGLGAVQRLPELTPGFDAEFGKEVLLTVGRMEIDLHRTFVTGPVGLTIALDELFEPPAALTLGDRTLPTLGPVATFLQVCVNAAVGDVPARACSLRDVVQLGPVAEREADRVIATAERWRIGLVVKRAVDLAWSGLGLDDGPLSEWAEGYEAGLRERVCLRSYLTAAHSYSRPAASLLVIPGVRPRLRYLRALVFPQRSYLRSRGWDLRAHARRALAHLRRHRGAIR